MPYVGLDVGGTAIKAALLDADFTRLTTRSVPTPRSLADPAGAVLNEIANIVAGFSEHELHGIGVVIPGIVDEKTGIAKYSKNLGWHDVPFRELLAQRFRIPVAFGHDVRAGGLAESTIGAAQGFSNSAFIPVGTGIAAALIVRGELYSADGYAGEIGHIDAGGGMDCPCGAHGCLETVASCPAIVSAYQLSVGAAQSRDVNPAMGSAAHRLAAVESAGLEAEDVVRAALAGDPLADSVLNTAIDALTRTVGNLVGLLAPEVIVFGGGLFCAGEPLLHKVSTALSARLSFHRMPELRLATLGSSAGCIGAGIMAAR